MDQRILSWICGLCALLLACTACGSTAEYPIGITQPGVDLTGIYRSASELDGLGSLTLMIGPIDGRPRDEVYEASLRSDEGLLSNSAYGTGTVGDNHAAFDFSIGNPGEFYVSMMISAVKDQITSLTAELVFPDQAETLVIDFIPINSGI